MALFNCKISVKISLSIELEFYDGQIPYFDKNQK